MLRFLGSPVGWTGRRLRRSVAADTPRGRMATCRRNTRSHCRSAFRADARRARDALVRTTVPRRLYQVSSPRASGRDRPRNARLVARRGLVAGDRGVRRVGTGGPLAGRVGGRQSVASAMGSAGSRRRWRSRCRAADRAAARGVPSLVRQRTHFVIGVRARFSSFQRTSLEGENRV